MATTFPLAKINRDFRVFAEDRKRLAEMSSQVLILESFLNEKFSRYFPNPDTDYISIAHAYEVVVDTYFEIEIPPANSPYNTGHRIVYGRTETPPTPKTTTPVYFDYEDFGALPEDFRLILPSSIQGDSITVSNILAVVDRYVIGTKKYDIFYAQ